MKRKRPGSHKKKVASKVPRMKAGRYVVVPVPTVMGTRWSQQFLPGIHMERRRGK